MPRIRRAIVAPTVLLLPLLAGVVPHVAMAAGQTPAGVPAPAATTPGAQAPAATAPQNLRVLVVDIQALLQKSKAAQMVRQQIEQKGAEYRKEIARQEQILHAEQDALQRDQSKLSPAALNKKGREFQQKVTALNRSVESKRATLEKSNADAFTTIQTAMLKITADIAHQRQANLVFQRSDLVLFDKKFDVTDEVLERLNKDLPAVTVSFTAPPPAATASASAAPRGEATKLRRR
jgi:Skp family chaperone for outer membrane proteins